MSGLHVHRTDPLQVTPEKPSQVHAWQLLTEMHTNSAIPPKLLMWLLSGATFWKNKPNQTRGWFLLPAAGAARRAQGAAAELRNARAAEPCTGSAGAGPSPAGPD